MAGISGGERGFQETGYVLPPQPVSPVVRALSDVVLPSRPPGVNYGHNFSPPAAEPSPYVSAPFAFASQSRPVGSQAGGLYPVGIDDSGAFQANRSTHSGLYPKIYGCDVYTPEAPSATSSVSAGYVSASSVPSHSSNTNFYDMAAELTNGGSERLSGPDLSIPAPPGISCSKRNTASFKQPGPLLLLHGTLGTWIYEARRLPNMDLVSERVRQCCTMFSDCKKPPRDPEGRPVRKLKPKKITSDPYVSVLMSGARLARTRVITNDSNPDWSEQFLIPVAHYADEVIFRLKDDDLFGAQHIGDVYIPTSDLMGGEKVDGWFDILGPGGKVVKIGAQLHLSVQFFPIKETKGVAAQQEYSGILRSYFPLRKGCRTALYQDAHVHDGQLPDIPLENGKYFEHRKCWEEICAALLGAHHMIYIAGWSIYDKVHLLRENPPPGMPQDGTLTLGDLLKRKSAEGVRVLLLVWDDKTSHNSVLLKTGGVMQTHDEETRKFFKHSGVICRLAPRYGDSKLSWFRQKVVGTLYTHHQKTVVVDTPRGDEGIRELTAFVGGLDLCDGRFDTPNHSIFRTMQGTHKGDYHQPSFTSGEEAGGPRQPWHDLHSRVEGPAAYDVLTNFEQRWKKAKWRTGSGDLIDVDRVAWLRTPRKTAPLSGDPAAYVSEEGDPETWYDQIFRSIDSGSAQGFPKKEEEAVKQHLICMKNLRVDASIHSAYVEAIRRAQKFIYIENQYFVGSSYHWPSYKNAGADHLIPMEIALKIASKIRAGERFVVYVVIPMFPEGVPEGAAVQEILFFQSQTMEMMYHIIADALRQKGLLGQEKPQDYLLFFCLGNREAKSEGEQGSLRLPADPHQAAAQQARRFMIYVHSKGMIVDDEYVIIGSANINQRSMDGSRDTEIAVGAYQPEYTWAKKRRHPRGQIYGFRTSLWAEHTARFEECFTDPASLETARKMKSIGDENWAQWASDRVTEMESHLLTYPILVNDDGTLSPLPDCDTFPDLGGKILGSSQQTLPDGLTS